MCHIKTSNKVQSNSIFFHCREGFRKALHWTFNIENLGAPDSFVVDVTSMRRIVVKCKWRAGRDSLLKNQSDKLSLCSTVFTECSRLLFRKGKNQEALQSAGAESDNTLVCSDDFVNLPFVPLLM